MSGARPSLRVVTAGHVDHGKSTVIGRLLADTGSLPQGKLEAVRSFCERNSRPFEYAFLLDALKDEQSQGITIDAARVFFKTARRDYLLIDAPGHVEFLKNMVSGASQASAALLVIDAEEGIRENSRRHGYLLSMLGIGQVAVLVNKMDRVGYREKDFDCIRRAYAAFLKKIGVVPTFFIPVSGLHGDNISAASPNMRWHRGPTVLKALESFHADAPPHGLPFRLPVQDVYKFTAFGDSRRIVAGTVASGAVAPGDEVVFHPSGKSAVVRTIESFPRGALSHAEAGMATGLTLDEQLYVRRGEIAALKNGPAPAVTSRLRANVFWLGGAPLSPGKDYVLKLAAARTTARVEKVLRVIDAVSLSKKRGARVGKNEVAECVLALDQAVAFDRACDNLVTGRFVLIDDYEISGGGLVQEALPDEAAWMRGKVALRNAKWQKSIIAQERREERYRQKSSLVLVTGRRDSRRKEVAKALEASLFEAGRIVYFLGLGSVLYGVDADIRDGRDHHREDIRRLAELAHLMLDAGVILIVSASEFAAEDLEILSAAVEPERIETVWVGSGAPSLECGVVLKREGVAAAVEAVRERLVGRGWLS